MAVLTLWMKYDRIMPTEMSNREGQMLYHLTYMWKLKEKKEKKKEKKNLLEADRRLVIARGRR